MSRAYPVYISKHNKHSISRYIIRAEIDSCLHDDVEEFMANHGGRLDILVDKLMNNDFFLSRYTDPSYPYLP